MMVRTLSYQYKTTPRALWADGLWSKAPDREGSVLYRLETRGYVIFFYRIGVRGHHCVICNRN